jgi:iron(III) transport system substrate-binding protein
MDLVDPRWKGRVAIARPLFGTTATHAAALFAQLGPERAKEFFRRLVANGAAVVSGNATVKDMVAAGEVAVGLTDTDDVNLAVLAGAPVRVIFPDQQPGGLGALMIPNSVAILKGAPHPADARLLVDHLLSREVEAALAASRSAQVPLRTGIARAPWIPADLVVSPVTWDAVADAFPASREFIRAEIVKD